MAAAGGHLYISMLEDNKLIELDALKGRDKLPGYDVESLLHY